jgi:YidC/Oxa1 family membrane protein insertase
MSQIFTAIFYQPILNILIFLYNTVSFKDLGVAIILMTVVIKLALWPLSRSSIKSQKTLQELQPQLEELKKKFGKDRVGLSQATMELYKDKQINPLSSCLPLLIQLPFLFAVYRVFRNSVSNQLDLTYSFINRPAVINTFSLGFLDLAHPSIYLAVLAGLAQFVQAKMMLGKTLAKKPGQSEEDMAAIMNKQMLYFMPALTVFIGTTLPAGLTLYWFVLTLLTALQQILTVSKNSSQKTAVVVDGEIVK